MPDSPAQPRSVKTTVDLPMDVWRAAKIRAMDEQSDLRSIIIAALTAYLDVRDTDQSPRARRR